MNGRREDARDKSVAGKMAEGRVQADEEEWRTPVLQKLRKERNKLGRQKNGTRTRKKATERINVGNTAEVPKVHQSTFGWSRPMSNTIH